MKKTWSILMLTTILLVSAGCAQNTSVSESGGNVTASETLSAEINERTEVDVALEIDKTEPAAQTTEVKQPTEDERNGTEKGVMTETISVYYTDPDVMDLLVAKRDITYKDEQDKYMASFKELQSSGSEDQISLWEKVELLSITSEKNTVIVDIHLPNEARLGSGGELFAISALQNTFFQFSEVESLELLVDGEQVETLMGHVELEHPMVRK